MLTVATLLWDVNDKSESFSSMYSTEWVEKLYRGFARNLTCQWRFVLFTERQRKIGWPVEQIVQPDLGSNGYADCIRPYALNEPMILVGLDTVVTGNIDHLAEYCMTADKIALPRDPYQPSRACNGVALVPAGMAHVAHDHRGENDMEWMRKQPHIFIDDLWPGHVVSWKGHVEKHGIGNASVIYFHGDRKPHQMQDNPIIQAHWR